LPMFPRGVTPITEVLAFAKQDGQVTYFSGQLPVFSHPEDDLASFRMITGQFCVNGGARQSDIIRVFGVTPISVKRSVKIYREKGPKGFYARRATRGPAVLVDAVVAQAEERLAEGATVAAVAEELKLKLKTFQKPFRVGRVRTPLKKAFDEIAPAVAGVAGETAEADCGPAASSKSQRVEADCAAPMGRGATATLERFAAALDLANGGVLLALPALLVCGLLRHADKYFRLPKGFYGLASIFLLLAFMTLARLRSVEALRYYSPGEWGKLLGIDRAPEVRTLRIKLKHLADEEQAFAWIAELCQDWMMAAPE